MARKLPAAVLQARGSFDHDPQRKRVDPIVDGELGNAPTYFAPDQKQVWEELKAQIPTGLAKSADRMIAEIASRLMHKFRTVGLNASELSQLINALGKLGCSPADRSKCATPPAKPDKDEFSDF